jgi:arsenate reductase
MEDPAEVEGSDAVKSQAFRAARALIARRIDLMLALPMDKLQRVTLGKRLDEIAFETQQSPARKEN